MNELKLKIYHALPHSLRSLAANLYGYYIKIWRYGTETERLVEEALEREHWDHKQWEAWRQNRLASLLCGAATQTPYYRAYWLERSHRENYKEWKILKNWPVLKKEVLRENPYVFLAENCNPRRMFQEHTSGTTGTPLTLWAKRDTLHRWYALFEARWRRWYGVSYRDRWAIVGGKHVVPFNQARPPFWVWNAALNQLYLSSLHIRPDFSIYYLNAIRNYGISYLYGYTSAIYSLALYALDQGIQPQLKVVITEAEPLFDWQRQVISQAFCCPVRETYGQAETVCAASECECGNLHLWPEVGILELLDNDGNPVSKGESGRMICTGLLNDSMPLVRYDLMDIAQLHSSNFSCPCGRKLPVLKKILGRMDDIILTKDGRRIVQIDTILAPQFHIREAQIIQETWEDFTIKIVPANLWKDENKNTIISALRQCVGDVNVSIEVVPEIKRTWAGKFRIINSKVTRKSLGGNP